MITAVSFRILCFPLGLSVCLTDFILSYPSRSSMPLLPLISCSPTLFILPHSSLPLSTLMQSYPHHHPQSFVSLQVHAFPPTSSFPTSCCLSVGSCNSTRFILPHSFLPLNKFMRSIPRHFPQSFLSSKFMQFYPLMSSPISFSFSVSSWNPVHFILPHFFLPLESSCNPTHHLPQSFLS